MAKSIALPSLPQLEKYFMVTEKKYNRITGIGKMNKYMASKGINAGIQAMIKKYGLTTKEGLIVSVAGKDVLTVNGKVQFKDRINKLNRTKATDIIIEMTKEEIVEYFNLNYAEFFTKSRQIGTNKMVYDNIVKDMELAFRAFIMDIYGTLGAKKLKGYAMNKLVHQEGDKKGQINVGVFIELMAKIMFGLEPVFSYNDCDIYLTKERKTIEIKSTCFNPCSLNGKGREQVEYVEGQDIKEYLELNCKSSDYMVFTGINPIDSLYEKNWLYFTRNEFIAYASKRIKFDNKSATNGGYGILRVKTTEN